MVIAARPRVGIAAGWVVNDDAGMVCSMQSTLLLPGPWEPSLLTLAWSLHWLVVIVPVNLPVELEYVKLLIAPLFVEPSASHVPEVTAQELEVTESPTPVPPPVPPPPDPPPGPLPSHPSGGGPMPGPHVVPWPLQSCNFLETLMVWVSQASKDNSKPLKDPHLDAKL